MPGVTTHADSFRPITLLSAAAFCNSTCLRVTDPMLPMLAHDFHTSVGEASAVVTCFAFAYGVSQLVYGPFGDRFGKYRLVCIAMTLSAVAIAGGAVAQTLAQLAALRLLAGITTAGISPSRWPMSATPFPTRDAKPCLRECCQASFWVSSAVRPREAC